MSSTTWRVMDGAGRYRWDDGAQGIEWQTACLAGPGYRDDATILDARAFAARGLTARDAERAGAPAEYVAAVRDA